MSIEEIIYGLNSIAREKQAKNAGLPDGFPLDTGLLDDETVLREAIALLKTHPEAQPNEPLTPEDTLTMHGEPAFLHWPDGGEWVLIRVASQDREKVELVHRNGILAPIRFVFDGGGKLYRRPSKEAEEAMRKEEQNGKN